MLTDIFKGEGRGDARCWKSGSLKNRKNALFRLFKRFWHELLPISEQRVSSFLVTYKQGCFCSSDNYKIPLCNSDNSVYRVI